ncbi:hypothetical protein [Pseudoxanthomonas sp.]|uniref:hypothetical protein n=1 Tax=Pseudoxanthomonas sp. TaxID=1871049 RepID=UPI00263730FD|nr:hypothetical protein [Pseudoxanthomonas sp.]WDS36213.1 MAG: hypothetical protein O8I58_18410 [Pseudoxanthomonas sp.]
MNIEQIEYVQPLLSYELDHIRDQIAWSRRRRNEMEAKQREAVKRREAQKRVAEYAAVQGMSA